MWNVPDGYASILLNHHSMRVKVLVLDLEMRPVGKALTGVVLDGQVNVDADAEVTRSANLTILDTMAQLTFDSDSPANGALYADRMLQVIYGVRSPAGTWVDVPVITGPVTRFSRDGEVVTLEVQGKEVLSMGAAWRTRTYGKNLEKVDVIRNILFNEGERHFDFPRSSSKMPAPKTLTLSSVPWQEAKKIAAGMGKQLFYDGGGRAVLREPPGSAVFTFATGDVASPRPSVQSKPKVEFATDRVKNAVRVVGKKPKGQTKKVSASAVAPADHPLSPQRLGRNGEGRYLAEFIEDSSIGTDEAAERVARNRLDVLLAQLVSVRFDALPIPHLDPGDVIALTTGDFTIGKTKLRQFSIPLTTAGVMSVGYHRLQDRPKRRGRKGGRR